MSDRKFKNKMMIDRNIVEFSVMKHKSASRVIVVLLAMATFKDGYKANFGGKKIELVKNSLRRKIK